MNPRKRTLVFRGGALGDFLLTLPALQALAIEELTLVTRPAYSALLQSCGWNHEAVNLESAHLTPLFQAGTLPDSLVLWLRQFDEIYAWLTDADGLFQSQVDAARGANLLLLDPVVRATDQHASQQLATTLGRAVEPVCWPRLPQVAVTPQRYAIHPGSGSHLKNWPVERWLELMRRLAIGNDHISFLIIAGEADEQPLAEIKLGLRDAPWPIAYAEQLPLGDLVPLLLACQQYVGHDTGISHLAASLGVPTLALFGPTDATIWGPMGSHVVALRSPEGLLENLSVEAVLERLLD